MVVVGLPAQGAGNPPSTECASTLWNGNYWKIQVNDGTLSTIETNVSGAITLNSDGSWTNNTSDDVFRIVMKVGQGVGEDVIHEPPVNPVDLTTNGLSHVTFCFTDETPPTTAPPTTAPPTTAPPTTAPPTTAPPTTAPPTTAPPTTAPPTTAPPTTAPPTTDAIVDEVAASIVVTVAGSCEVDADGEGEGIINVTISVEGGADVVVRDGDGDVVASTSSSGSVTVPEGATYTWESAPSEGFEFPSGSETSGSITIETCSEVETLPFTGVNSEWLAILASALLAGGLTLVASTRGREQA